MRFIHTDEIDAEILNLRTELSAGVPPPSDLFVALEALLPYLPTKSDQMIAQLVLTSRALRNEVAGA